MRAVRVRTVVCATLWRPATLVPVPKATRGATVSSLATTVILTLVRTAVLASPSMSADTYVTAHQVSYLNFLVCKRLMIYINKKAKVGLSYKKMTSVKYIYYFSKINSFMD